MADVMELLHEYIAEHRAGGPADPSQYLTQVEGTDRKELAALIDGYLVRAPRAEWDQAAYERSSAPAVVEALERSLGESPELTALLPRLRERAGLAIGDLASKVRSALGVEDSQGKIEWYLERLEVGEIDSRGLSRRVLDALAGALSTSAEKLDQASAGPSGIAPAPALYRESEDQRNAESLELAADALAEPSSPGEWDEVDELFRRGR